MGLGGFEAGSVGSGRVRLSEGETRLRSSLEKTLFRSERIKEKAL
jgi:hypothetical protein